MKRFYRHDNYGHARPAKWYEYLFKWLGFIKVS